ncbi:hypothetical protein AC579_9892 [Pseudocercospora musae]|uniref:GTP-binding protein 8 n=1 Tax=Pseudocercospora musae TaxID=113226 RepID=A0A139I9V8_9PEZI|nr:hypothetical protein AC579_9892 [Pseudocercospora musae]
MDLLRLPPSLRQQIISSSTRTITTVAQNAPPTEQLLALTPSTLNSYNITHPPTPSNLRTAASFFQRTKPKLLFTIPHFRSFPLSSPFPEVTFLGRSNVGKSSLLNALFQEKNLARVSQRPGKTITMNAYAVDGSLVVVDMPGYGSGSREEWGKEILKYLLHRRQLRKTYVMIDAEHGVKRSDAGLLWELKRNGVAYQIVLSKVDKILCPRSKAPSGEGLSRRLEKLREIRERVGKDCGGGGDLLCCSSVKSLDVRGRRRIGVDELRWSVLEACGLQGLERLRKGDVRIQEEDDEQVGGVDTAAFAPPIQRKGEEEENVEEQGVKVYQ